MGTENDWSDCMTIKEMDAVVQSHCKNHENCDTCCIDALCGLVGGEFEDNPLELEKAYRIVIGQESVNHPNHYNRENSIECIDEMVLVFGREAVKNFCLCNIWKYRYRASDKNGEEDLKKSDWYMRKYKELCSNE